MNRKEQLKEAVKRSLNTHPFYPATEFPTLEETPAF